MGIHICCYEVLTHLGGCRIHARQAETSDTPEIRQNMYATPHVTCPFKF